MIEIGSIIKSSYLGTDKSTTLLISNSAQNVEEVKSILLNYCQFFKKNDIMNLLVSGGIKNDR